MRSPHVPWYERIIIRGEGFGTQWISFLFNFVFKNFILFCFALTKINYFYISFLKTLLFNIHLTKIINWHHEKRKFLHIKKMFPACGKCPRNVFKLDFNIKKGSESKVGYNFFFLISFFLLPFTFFLSSLFFF